MGSTDDRIAPDTPGDKSAAEANKSLVVRILDAHFERMMSARDEYAANLARRADATREMIFMDTVRRATPGVEPTWLIRAKRLHEELAQCIYVCSQAPSPDFPHDLAVEAEKRVRAFVDAMPGEATQARVDAAALVAILHAVSTRDAAFALVLDAGQPPSEVVCFAYSLLDPFLAIRLAMFEDDIARILDRWPDDTPRRPSKWTLLSDLWAHVAGVRLSPETWRRYDPRKKQVKPKPKKKRKG